MKFSVRYYSRGGNTRAVAEVIAETLGVKAESIDTPVDENVDFLFIGGGLFMGRLDGKLTDYIMNISPEKIGNIVPFGTSGGQKKVIDKIKECAAKKGVKIDERDLYIQMGIKGHSWFGLKGGKLNAKQINKTKEFAKGFIA